MLIATDHRAGPLKMLDLKHSYYEPAGITDPMRMSHPDPLNLERQNWYQVLYFVNMFANLYGRGSAGVARNAERLLHTRVPLELRTHESIKQWLLDYWKSHS